MRTIVYLLILSIYSSYSQNFPFKISRIDDKNLPSSHNSNCESRVKVNDVKPSLPDCFFGFQFNGIYPVLIENFDYKEELPNNWVFNNSYTDDDDYSGNGNGHIWLGDAYSNNNLVVSGGKAFLIIKRELVSKPKPGTTFNRNYNFTGANLSSSFKIRQGIFTGDIKLPENQYLWPAFWLLGGTVNNLDYREIDIFEFYDPSGTVGPVYQSSCDTYHQLKMAIHGMNGASECKRSRKFPVTSNFFSSGTHHYQCTWTDYKTHFFLDNTFTAYATRYYDGPYVFPSPCYKNSPAGLPSKTHDCFQMSLLNGCSLTNPFNNNCMVFNKVDKDESYPLGIRPMGVRISNAIWPGGFNELGLLSNWNNYSQVDKEIAVDQVVIWQPINCGATYNLCSKNDFLNASGGSSFLGGSQFNIGNSAGTCNFIHNDPGFPLHLLATNEIGFVGGDIIIDEGSYLRADIITCSTIGFTQKLANGSQMPAYNEVSDEEIKTFEEKEMKEFIKNNPELADSLIKAYNQQLYEENLTEMAKQKTHSVSEIDNGSIILFPNPTTDIIHIDMDEEDFNDILYLEVINNMGQNFRMEKSQHLDFSSFAPGMYQLKFVFSHGLVVVKNVSKQ
jgi:hypothetical protein